MLIADRYSKPYRTPPRSMHVRQTMRGVSRAMQSRQTAFWQTLQMPTAATRSWLKQFIPSRCDREAIQQAGAAGGDEIRLAAPAARMRRVPRAVAAALLVGVPELRRALAVARPVVARVIAAVGVRAAVRLRARQNVVLIRRVADAVDGGVLFRQRELLAQDVAEPRLLDRIAVQLAH